MATFGQVYYRVVDNNSGGYISTGIDIFEDIVAGMGATQFNKLGVQAPPGTQMVLNNSKAIMVGRSGMYELDEGIAITSLKFVRPRLYIKDEEASAKAKEDGTTGMQKADADRSAAMADLRADYPTIPTDENNPNYQPYWDRYNEIQSTYIKAYQEALNQFNTGCNGIYVLPNPSNINAPENYSDLANIIVDFTYI